jgi:iron complex outermembrane recepter protein
LAVQSVRRRLLGSSILAAAVFAVAAPASVALAQTSAPADAAPAQEVVVTGSILHHRNVDSDAPLTVETSADLEIRGITTVQSAVQNLSGNNSGALPNSFSANGAFASGASGASLRGLLTQSTLVLIDGLRAAYYPLADDGQRNFVDLNTIPDIIVDRVEVLQDGASATYGADAIAGVINIITKKSFQGFQGKAEGGWSQQGGAGERNFSALFGKGDLGADGYNAYVGVEYQKDDALFNRQRGFPYNTANLTRICNGGSTTDCLFTNTNVSPGVLNGFDTAGNFNGLLGTTVAFARPYNAAGTAAVPGSAYGLLNPALGCGVLKPVTVTAAAAAAAGLSSADVGSYCQQDLTAQYGEISPSDERFSISAHGVKAIPGGEVYGEFNYYQNTVESIHSPTSITGTTPPYGFLPRFAYSPAILPVYVCPEGSATHVCSATDAGAKLNPNDPYASLNESARILYRLGDVNTTNTTFSQAYRFAAGAKGKALGWDYTADLTGMQSDLTVTQRGYPYMSNLLTAINQGTYNFADPSQNSAAIRSFVAPTNVHIDNSKMLQLQGNVTRSLFDLPGGPAQVGLGASIRYESLYDPSANPQNGTPAERYLTINPFSSIGERTVYSAFGELGLPVIKGLDVNFSGRYDNYSTGQDHFSPKVGLKYKPFNMLTLRATYSQGFAIPSFAQTSGNVTGYVPETLATQPLCGTLHPVNTSTYCNYSIGVTSVGNPKLKPETSTNLTTGFVFQPWRNIAFSADYYRIEEKQIIAGGNYQPAIAAYYQSNGTVTNSNGFVVVPDIADINAPNAAPRAAFVIAPNQNQSSIITDGFDFSLSYRQTLPWWNAKFTSILEGTYISNFTETLADGTKLQFAGTLGPDNPTAGSGTPRTRFNWQNTVDFGKATLSATVYYTGGYRTTAEDIAGPGTAGDCIVGNLSPTFVESGAPFQCHVSAFTDVALTATYQATKHVQLYVNIDNLFDTNAPLDMGTYGGYNYNPVWANSGIIGRFIKVGAKATF